MDLHIRNNLFPPLFTIINDINGDLNFQYGLELLGQGLAIVTCVEIGNMKNSRKFDLLKMCMKYF